MGQHREQRLEALRRRGRTSVLVVGGGINGISTFRELALQGVDVVLVERGDFMSGASSAPSRMIHGGLRYMENGEFDLVKESLRERNLLLRNAPHLVTPLPTLIPIADHFSGIWTAARRFFGGRTGPGSRGSLIVKLGLTLYDLYSGAQRGMPRHRFIGRRETRRRWPALRSDVVCSALYHDARISHPERLGIEMLLDTAREAPQALALNHVGLASFGWDGALLVDSRTGERFSVDADVVVNATGAWIDLTNDTLATHSPRLIGGTKGAHIVIDNVQLRDALGGTMVYFANRDGRVCILFAHLGNVLAGSTDISVDTPEDALCTPDEVAYILGSIREVFPEIAVGEDDIVYRFSGVRPLPRSDGDVNAHISRDHSCEWLSSDTGAARPVLNLIGGKWTTFRAFGAEAADMVLARLGTTRRRATGDLAIGGGRAYPAKEERRAWTDRIAGSSGLDAERIDHLFERYGTRAEELCHWIAGQPDRPLPSLPRHTHREIEWLLLGEHVVTLDDLVMRRMTIAFTGELSLAAIRELGEVAAATLGWSAERLQAEMAALLRQLELYHALTADDLRRRDPPRKDDHVRSEESAYEPAVPQRQVS